MNKEQIISNIMKEYKKYGLEQNIAEIIYDLAIKMDVPKETIYPGMRYQFNAAFGIKDQSSPDAVGKGFIEHSFEEMKMSNPTISDEKMDSIFANEISSEGLENLVGALGNVPHDIKDATLKNLKKYVRENV